MSKFHECTDLSKSIKIKKKQHVEYLAVGTNNAVPDVLPEGDIDYMLNFRGFKRWSF